MAEVAPSLSPLLFHTGESLGGSSGTESQLAASSCSAAA